MRVHFSLNLWALVMIWDFESFRIDECNLKTFRPSRVIIIHEIHVQFLRFFAYSILNIFNLFLIWLCTHTKPLLTFLNSTNHYESCDRQVKKEIFEAVLTTSTFDFSSLFRCLCVGCFVDFLSYFDVVLATKYSYFTHGSLFFFFLISRP